MEVRSKLRDESIDALVFLKKYYKTKWIILILFWLYVCKIYSHSIHITKSLKSCLYGITIKISIPRFPDPDSPRNYFKFPVPRGMKKWHSPIPRGMKSAGELEPLFTAKEFNWFLKFRYKRSIQKCENVFHKTTYSMNWKN